MKKHPSVQQMRELMNNQPPPYYFLTLDEITLRSVAAGTVTARLQQQAAEQVTELDAQALGIEQQAKRTA